jgi:hypothetical protein
MPLRWSLGWPLCGNYKHVAPMALEGRATAHHHLQSIVGEVSWFGLLND